MALTTQRIHEAADQLHEQGIKPTLAEVRKALGGGSFTTISEAMKSWRQEQQQEQQLQQVDLPSGIYDRLQVLGADIWQSAIGIANERLTAEREALATAQHKAQQKVDEAQEAVKTLEAEQIDLLEQLDELTLQMKKANQDAALAKSELLESKKQHHDEMAGLNEELRSVNKALDMQRQKTELTQQRVDELYSKLDDSQEQLAAAREEVAVYKAQQRAQETEIKRLTEAAAESKQQHTVIQTELSERITERNQLNKDLAKTEGKLETLISQIEGLVSERDKLQVENKELHDKNKNLSIVVSHLEADKKMLLNKPKN